MISVIALVGFVLFRITNDYEDSMENIPTDDKQHHYQVTVLPNGTTVKVEQIDIEVRLTYNKIQFESPMIMKTAWKISRLMIRDTKATSLPSNGVTKRDYNKS